MTEEHRLAQNLNSAIPALASRSRSWYCLLCIRLHADQGLVLDLDLVQGSVLDLDLDLEEAQRCKSQKLRNAHKS